MTKLLKLIALDELFKQYITLVINNTLEKQTVTTQELSKQDEMIIQYFEDGNTIDDKGICYDSLGKQLKVYNFTFTTRKYIILYYKGVNLRVHRLQAFKKYNYDMFKDGIIVRHLNDIGNDNRVSNIAIGTTKDNLTDVRRIAGVTLEYLNDLIKRMLKGLVIILLNELLKLSFYYNSTQAILGLLRILLNDNPLLNGCHYRYSLTSRVLKLGHLGNRKLIRQLIRSFIRNQILNNLPIDIDELHSRYGNFYKYTTYYYLIRLVRELIEQLMNQLMCQLMCQLIRSFVRNQILNNLPINVNELHSRYGNFYSNVHYNYLIRLIRKLIEQLMHQLMCQLIRFFIRNQILNSLPININELRSRYGNFYSNANYYRLIKLIRELIEQLIEQLMYE